MLQAIKRFASDRGGATSIEYSLIAVLISIVVVSSATVIGTGITKPLDIASTNLNK